MQESTIPFLSLGKHTKVNNLEDLHLGINKKSESTREFQKEVEYFSH